MTHNKELLMAFVYFDQSHCGYLLERDVEEILYTLGLHLSRAQVSVRLAHVTGVSKKKLEKVKSCMSFVFQIKKLLNKPVVRESCYYRKLTDRGKDEPTPSSNEAQIENLTGDLLGEDHCSQSPVLPALISTQRSSLQATEVYFLRQSLASPRRRVSAVT